MTGDLSGLAPAAHPLDYADTDYIWTCPETGVKVHKDRIANAAQRLRIIRQTDDGAEDPETSRAAWWHLCRRSPLVWMNLFGWTYKIKEYRNGEARSLPADLRDSPFVTWPVQDSVVMTLVESLSGKHPNVVVDKSREMGASWLALAVLTHQLVFNPRWQAKVVSSKEDNVDGKHNTDTLLWKVRYLIRTLPDWMQPQIDDAHMRVANTDNGSTIFGESTNTNAGRSNRRDVMYVDEAAAIDKLDDVINSMHSAATVRWFTSTPKGPGPYKELRFSGRARVCLMGFWDHPEKGRDRSIEQDAVGALSWTSPYLEAQKKLASPRDIAQNELIDHLGSGAMVFSPRVITMMQAAHVRQPSGRWVVDTHEPYGAEQDEVIRKQQQSRVLVQDDPARGSLWTWCAMEPHPSHGQMRPDANRDYVIGTDIGLGTAFAGGEGGSNSVHCVLDVDSGSVVAMFASNSVSVDEFARVGSLLGLVFSGRRGPALLVWEANGAGNAYANAMRKLRYPRIYKRRHIDTPNERNALRLGWHMTAENKIDLCIRTDGAMARGEVSTPCADTVRELGEYVYDETGRVVHGTAESQNPLEKKAHGDRVIAFMLAVEGRRFAGKFSAPDYQVEDPLFPIYADRRG